jgi:hypothetical protein
MELDPVAPLEASLGSHSLADLQLVVKIYNFIDLAEFPLSIRVLFRALASCQSAFVVVYGVPPVLVGRLDLEIQFGGLAPGDTPQEARLDLVVIVVCNFKFVQIGLLLTHYF